MLKFIRTISLAFILLTTVSYVSVATGQSENGNGNGNNSENGGNGNSNSEAAGGSQSEESNSNANGNSDKTENGGDEDKGNNSSNQEKGNDEKGPKSEPQQQDANDKTKGTGPKPNDVVPSSTQAAPAVAQEGKTVKLETIYNSVHAASEGEIIDAQLVTVRGFLLYEIKLLQNDGLVRNVYYYAKTGRPVTSR